MVTADDRDLDREGVAMQFDELPGAEGFVGVGGSRWGGGGLGRREVGVSGGWACWNGRRGRRETITAYEGGPGSDVGLTWRGRGKRWGRFGLVGGQATGQVPELGTEHDLIVVLIILCHEGERRSHIAHIHM